MILVFFSKIDQNKVWLPWYHVSLCWLTRNMSLSDSFYKISLACMILEQSWILAGAKSEQIRIIFSRAQRDHSVFSLWSKRCRALKFSGNVWVVVLTGSCLKTYYFLHHGSSYEHIKIKKQSLLNAHDCCIGMFFWEFHYWNLIHGQVRCQILC